MAILRGNTLVALLTILLTALTAAAHADDGGHGHDSPPTVSGYIRDLQSPDPDRRRDAAYGLTQMRPVTPEAIAALMQALKAGDLMPSFIVAAGVPIVPALRRALKDSDSGMRSRAIDALSLMGPPKEVVSDLAQALKDPDRGVRSKAIDALGRMGPAAETRPRTSKRRGESQSAAGSER